ncbi:hypothetical protein CRUP_034911 [Coryphaenoides rupestris]|nr:hypothetical protein CRUP_034911 [Coryphaenoides rupestris]
MPIPVTVETGTTSRKARFVLGTMSSGSRAERPAPPTLGHQQAIALCIQFTLSAREEDRGSNERITLVLTRKTHAPTSSANIEAKVVHKKRNAAQPPRPRPRAEERPAASGRRTDRRTDGQTDTERAPREVTVVALTAIMPLLEETMVHQNHPPTLPVVIIGNGPSGICLSYLLSGYKPYFDTGQCTPTQYCTKSCRSPSSSPSLNRGDLRNPVAVLFDTLLHPNADLPMNTPPSSSGDGISSSKSHIWCWGGQLLEGPGM